MSGYAGTPLAKKLGLREGGRLFVHDAPEHDDRLLAPWPAAARTVARIDAATDVSHRFAVRRAALAVALRAALQRMRPEACIWVSWPKKAARRPTDITEDLIREVALPLGLVHIKVCAVDETWSGLKLVIRTDARPPAVARSRGAWRGSVTR